RASHSFPTRRSSDLYVGLEFAQMFARFGSRVTVVHRRSHLLAREDHDISQAILAMLQTENICFHLGAECISFERRGEQKVVKLSDRKSTRLNSSHVK